MKLSSFKNHIDTFDYTHELSDLKQEGLRHGNLPIAWQPHSLLVFAAWEVQASLENQPQNTGKDLLSASNDHPQSRYFWDGGSFRADSAVITYRATPV